MAKIYGYNGAIVRILLTDAQIEQYGAPTQFDTVIDFDPDTNADVIAAINADWSSHTLTGGVLCRSGQVVTIHPDGEKTTALKAASTGFDALPDWARTMMASDAAAYINAQIWNGYTQGQADAWIDSTVTSLATAKTALKQIAGAVIALRDLFILTAKLLIFIRDLVIRFRS